MRFSLIYFYLLSIVVTKQVAVYWGQNLGGGEKDLADYCKDDSINIIIITYLNEFNGRDTPKLGLKTQCKGQWCTEIGANIRECQSKGKKILLSLGGPKGLYGLTSQDNAAEFAQQIWKIFFDRSDSKLLLGEVSLDGIDLSIENNQGLFYKDFVNALRSNSDTSGKKIIISASPGCKMPSTSMDEVLNDAQLDMAFVKFYNEPTCETDQNINLQEWSDWALEKNTWLYIGVASSRQSVKSGYLPIDNVKSRISTISKSLKTYGGVALSDVGSAFDDDTFGKDLANYVHSHALSLPHPTLLLSILIAAFVSLL